MKFLLSIWPVLDINFCLHLTGYVWDIPVFWGVCSHSGCSDFVCSR